MVRSSHRLAGTCVAIVAAGGCGDGLRVDVDYEIVGLVPAVGGVCGAAPTAPPAAPGATRVRFTFRDHTATGPGPLRCDAVLPRGLTRPVLAVPRRGEPVDLWVEYFADDGALVARGERRDVDLTGGTVTIPVGPSNGYACDPAQPSQPRAFHSATLLPTGEVLFLGGLVGAPGDAGAEFAPAAGAYVTSSAEIYDPASGRVSPIAIAGFTPRAFHQVVVLGTDPNGDVRLAVSGGLGVGGDASAAGNVAAIGGAAGEAPWQLVSADVALGRAGAQPVATELLVYVPTTRTINRSPITGATGATFAAAGAVDVEFGSPRIVGGGVGAGGDALDVLHPSGELDVRLTGLPRVGASLVAATATTALWLGGELTGASLYDKIIQLDAVAALASGAAPPAAGLNRAFGAAVRLDDEILYAGGLRILTGVLTDTTGAVPGVRIDVATDTATDLIAPELTGAAYPAAAQLPGHGGLVSGGAVAGDLACAGTLACVSGQSVRFDAAGIASATGAPGLARYGHALTRLDNGIVLVSGGFTAGATAGTIRAVSTLEQFEPHLAADDPLADIGPVRAPGEVATMAGVPIAPCTLVQGGGADAGGPIDALDIDALDIDADIDAM
ncbi:MAG: hypothetical protein IPL61_16265 [Myxococcales bacterium]|nr:hypothetical protein [Myxococcales bacterium]